MPSAEVELPADWREAVAAIARATRTALLRHPWAVQALQGRSGASQDGAFGPNGIRHFEQSLAAVAAAPLDTTAKLDLLTIVDDYVFGHVLRVAEQQTRSDARTAADGAAIARYIEGLLADGGYPHISALAGDPAAGSIGDPAELDRRFERGLAALCDLSGHRNDPEPTLGCGVVVFARCCGCGSGRAGGGLVVAVGVEGELAAEFAGGGVDDADVAGRRMSSRTRVRAWVRPTPRW